MQIQIRGNENLRIPKFYLQWKEFGSHFLFMNFFLGIRKKTLFLNFFGRFKPVLLTSERVQIIMESSVNYTNPKYHSYCVYMLQRFQLIIVSISMNKFKCYFFHYFLSVFCFASFIFWQVSWDIIHIPYSSFIKKSAVGF